MFANFTEETCTGTGATLVLTGITTGNIAFSKSFADGDTVAYVLEDSGGTIKVSGIGTYVSATDDITRSDIWNWNGTVIDDDPSTNITLSSGTHTVRCALVGKNVARASGDWIRSSGAEYNIPHNWVNLNGNISPVADRMYLAPANMESIVKLTKVLIYVTTLDAAATNTRVGVYDSKADGTPDNLLFDSGNISLSATGLISTTLSAPITLGVGRYWFAFVSDTAAVASIRSIVNTQINSSIGGVSIWNNFRRMIPYQNSVTGALPASVSISGILIDAAAFGWQ